MSKDKEENKLARLHDEISKHDQAYYLDNNPLVSDTAYDELVARVKKIEEELGYSGDSPVDNVGDDRKSGFAKVKHSTPMLSIGNTYDDGELRKYLEKLNELCDGPVEFVAEPKVDGIAITLIYMDGYLEQAVTRGNGVEGDDVTANIKTVGKVPKEIDILGYFEVRGEVYMPTKEFEEWNEQRRALGEQEFANARNACAGTVKTLDVEEVRKRPLSFVAYTIVDAVKHVSTHKLELSLLDELGFPTLKPMGIGGIDEMCHIVSKFKNDDKFDFPTDGVVVRVNDANLWEDLGNTNKSPRWLIAFKCEPERAETRLLDVDITIGRTGVFTPTGIVEPTQLAGTTVQRANLHNPNKIAGMDLHIGDIVILEKAGEIIPNICGVVYEKRPKDAKPIKFPTVCPTCHAELLNEGTRLRCLNPHCRSRQYKNLVYFVSRPCMNIEGFGPSTITTLLNHGSVSCIADIYRLDYEKLREAGFGKVEATNLLEAILTSKGQDVVNVLISLGIPGIAGAASTMLLDKFGSIPAIMNASEEELSSVKGIGPLLVTAIREWFSDVGNQMLVKDLTEVGLQMERMGGEDIIPYSKCVVTGGLPKLPRHKIKEILLDKHVKVMDRVTKDTDFLLIGLGQEGSSKHKRAMELGIPIYNLSDYLKK